MAEADPQQNPGEIDGWPKRRRYWQRKLGRLRLGVEPLEAQLAKFWRITWLLTAIPIAMGLFIVALFTAFRRPDVGAILASIIFLPIVAIAWIDFGLMRLRASRYERELHEHESCNPSRY